MSDLEEVLTAAESFIAMARDAIADEREGDLYATIAALGIEVDAARSLVSRW